MKHAKDLTLLAFFMLSAFLLACAVTSKASESTEIVEIDFTDNETTIHEVTFDDNEGTIVSVDADGNITVKVIEVNYESN